MTMMGWHFSGTHLDFDLSHIKVKAGLVLRMGGPLSLCERRFHASAKPLDALQYASGTIVSRVELFNHVVSEPLQVDTDKAVATGRAHIWVADAERTLHEFALWCANSALERERKAGLETDERSWQALEIKQLWLNGKATDHEMDAARDSAWDAAWDSAGDSDRVAARASARASARDSAWDSARVTARITGRVTGRVPAWVTAWDVQSEHLKHMLIQLAPRREGLR